ncbi:unnamed protein product [Larinioides sclopetarius]|uniref:CRAL-TRIO domain-containing protein n=1 Tax=Larinioides sclopetarius TaxID=280406 RepID=A0AAV2BQK0_9ARAC
MKSSISMLQDGKWNQMEEDKSTKMETISNNNEENVIYPLKINHIPASIRRKYEKFLHEIYKDDQKYQKELKKMLRSQEESNNVEFKDDFLRIFLLKNNYSVQDAFRMVLYFLDLRNKHSYFFKKIEVDFTTIPSGQFVTVLPQRHPDGTAIVLAELGKWMPEELSFEDFKSIARLTLYQELRNPVTQVTGFRFIYDFANTGYQHLKYCTPMNMYLLYHATFKCFPGNYLEVHFVNTNFVFSTLLTCFKPFLVESIRKILYFHSSVEDLLNYFPSSTLPTKYGGTLTEYYMADYLKRANEEQGDFPLGGLKNLF